MTIARRHTAIVAAVTESPGITIASLVARLGLPLSQVETAVWCLRDRSAIEASGEGWKRRHSSIRSWRGA